MLVKPRNAMHNRQTQYFTPVFLCRLSSEEIYICRVFQSLLPACLNTAYRVDMRHAACSKSADRKELSDCIGGGLLSAHNAVGTIENDYNQLTCTFASRLH